MLIFKTKTKRSYISVFWTRFWYLIPTISIHYDNKNTAMDSFYSKKEDVIYKGNRINATFYFIGLVIDFDYWFKLTIKHDWNGE